MKRFLLLLAAAIACSAQTCLVYAPPVFVDGEVPAGVKNGKNRVFTIAHAPAKGSTPILTLNGIVQRLDPSQDYTLSGNVITFTPVAKLPHDFRDNFQVWYRYQP